MLGNDLDRLEAELWTQYGEKVSQWKDKWSEDYIRATNIGWKMRDAGKIAWAKVPESIKQAMICERIKKMAIDVHQASCIILDAQEELTAGRWEDEESPHWIR